nr:SLC13 family permease [Chenggangzhangella methanolivorans]
MNPTFVTVAAVAVFAATYLVMAIGRAPGLRMDRAGAALAGAAFMAALGVLDADEIFAAIDHHTIALLLGMMIVAANLKLAGAFDLAGEALARRAARPLPLLVAVTVSTGVLSAFLVNDTICLVMTPLVVTLALKLRRDPVPYAIAVATRLQRRQRRDDHGQSAEHDHRLAVEDPLRRLRRDARPRGCDRPRAGGRLRGARVPARILRKRRHPPLPFAGRGWGWGWLQKRLRG